MMKVPEGMDACKVCGQPFTDKDVTATTCRDCLIRDIQRQANEMGIRVRVRDKVSRLQELRVMAAMVVMTVAIAATCLCFIGWIWQGIEVIRLILGGGK